MQLQFKENHNSITSFNPVSLSDFTVLTGLNGSGKTHLLQAISNGSCIIDQFAINQIRLFNYKDFFIPNQGASTGFHQKQIKDKGLAWLKNVQEKMGSLADEQIDNPIYQQALKQHCPIIGPSNNPRIHTPDQKLRNEFHRFLISYPKNISDITESDIGDYFSDQMDFLVADLSSIFSFYYKDFFNRVVTFHGVDGCRHLAKTEEEFLSENPKPWEEINKFLTEFNLPYEVNHPCGDPDKPFEVKLKNTVTDTEVPFNSLSSGETILIALIAARYQVEQGKIHDYKLLLLDEIDAFLHPSMIKGLLNIIDNVFIKNRIKVILVTHSPTTVALSPDIYLMKRNNQRIEIKKTTNEDALEILSEGFITLNKGLTIFDEISKQEISIISEGNNSCFLQKAIELHKLENIRVLDIGKSQSGAKQIKVLFDFLSHMDKSQKVIFVWDCDKEKSYGNLIPKNKKIPFVFQQNTANNLATKGIENLFPENLCERYTKTILLPDKKEKREFNENYKTTFMNDILERNEIKDFENFKPLIDLLENHLIETKKDA